MAKSAKYKIALSGTNCSGKTTLALDITARLKGEHHYLAEVVSSQDRKITWSDAHFPVNPVAHYGMVTNLILAETQAVLKGDADVVLVDRSVLDLFAIAKYDHPDSELINALGHMVKAYCATYESIFVLDPLPYQADGKRPDDDFRLATYKSLQGIVADWCLPNVHTVTDRPSIYKRIKGILGIQSKSDIGLAEKFQAIATSTVTRLCVPERKSPVTSDFDVWVFADPANVDACVATVKRLSTAYFGPHACIDVLAVPTSLVTTIANEYPTATWYYPNNENADPSSTPG